LNPEQWRKWIEQWQGLIAAVGFLLTAVVGLLTQVLKWEREAWSWRELLFALITILVVAAITVRSRSANASRLVDPDALKLDPRSPEQLVGAARIWTSY
jgi:hypothetical protein